MPRRSNQTTPSHIGNIFRLRSTTRSLRQDESIVGMSNSERIDIPASGREEEEERLHVDCKKHLRSRRGLSAVSIFFFALTVVIFSLFPTTCHAADADAFSDEYKTDGEWSKISGFFEKENSPWIDPDTPLEARTIRSLPSTGFVNDQERDFHLVFSDEFEVDGRTMHDGRDPRWTALHQDDLTNNPLHWYSHDAVQTSGGVLNITLDVHPQTFTYARPTGDPSSTPKTINVTKEYRSGMVQSWNKFCFIGGIIEISAKLPGDPRTGGLWPASTCVSSNNRHCANEKKKYLSFEFLSPMILLLTF
jgi:Beta-glucan synthesis-associated protein SKN1/KRE6/Sbg1